MACSLLRLELMLALVPTYAASMIHISKTITYTLAISAVMINQLVMPHQSNKVVAMVTMPTRNMKHLHTSFIPSSRLPKIRRICLQQRLYSYSSQSSSASYQVSKETKSISISKYNTNKYDRFRQEIIPAINLDNTSCSDDPISYKTNLINVGKRSIEVISPNRRSFNRTWKRMKPMIDIVLTSCIESKEDDNDTAKQIDDSDRRISSLADVGCDHGMLGISLSCISWVTQQQHYINLEDEENQSHNDDRCKSVSNGISFFPPTRIFGTDLSSIALKNGGLVSLKKINEALLPLSSFDDDLPINFHVGDGLKPLQKGEADAIILAGMGVETMWTILKGNVDRVQTKRIFVQPTNSRPQHLILLYEKLQQSSEWVLRDETISYLGGRWYINAYFEKGCIQGDNDNSFCFPGHFLVQSGTEEDIDAYDSYVKHHLRWLKEDFERPKCVLEDEDKRWLKYIQSSQENVKWKDLASWYSQ